MELTTPEMTTWTAALFCAFVAGTQGSEFVKQGCKGRLLPARWKRGCDSDRLVHNFANSISGSDDVVLSRYVTQITIFDDVPLVTSKGDVGLDPPHMRPGDVICLCDVASVPLAICKTATDDDETYKLVGNAYVHGIMDGEFLDMNPPEGTFSFLLPIFNSFSSSATVCLPAISR
jgi:hypothetical protein